MPYITIPVSQKAYQISFDDILNGMNESAFERQAENTHDTRTVYRARTPQRLLDTIDIDGMMTIYSKATKRRAKCSRNMGGRFCPMPAKL